MPYEELTSKQFAFVNYVFLGFTLYESYKIAYRVNGIKPLSISVAASRLLKNVKVQAKLKELRQKAEDDSVAKILEVKQVLTNILRTKIGDIAEFNIDNTRITFKDEALESPAVGYIRTETATIGKGDEKETVLITRVSLADKIRAAQELSKLLGGYQVGDVYNITDTKTLNIIVKDEETKTLLTEIVEGVPLDAESDDEGIQGKPKGIQEGQQQKSS